MSRSDCSRAAQLFVCDYVLKKDKTLRISVFLLTELELSLRRDRRWRWRRGPASVTLSARPASRLRPHDSRRPRVCQRLLPRRPRPRVRSTRHMPVSERAIERLRKLVAPRPGRRPWRRCGHDGGVGRSCQVHRGGHRRGGDDGAEAGIETEVNLQREALSAALKVSSSSRRWCRPSLRPRGRRRRRRSTSKGARRAPPPQRPNENRGGAYQNMGRHGGEHAHTTATLWAREQGQPPPAENMPCVRPTPHRSNGIATGYSVAEIIMLCGRMRWRMCHVRARHHVRSPPTAPTERGCTRHARGRGSSPPAPALPVPVC